MRFNIIFSMTVLIAVCGCAPTVWRKPDATQYDFNRQSAACRMTVTSSTANAAAMGGSALIIGLTQKRMFEDCMIANGWVADNDDAPTNNISDESLGYVCRGGVRCAEPDD